MKLAFPSRNTAISLAFALLATGCSGSAGSSVAPILGGSAPTATPTASATATPTAAPSGAPSATPTAASTSTPTPSAAPTAKPTATPTPAASATPTPVITPTPTPVSTATAAPTAKPTASPTPTPNPSVISVSPGTWTFVPFSNAHCADGSTTGLAVNPGTSHDLVVYFEGGGECWNALTCLTLMSAANVNGYDAATFAAEETGFRGSFLDRTVANNPFADASLVYVPYCTGDDHAGNNVATYVTSSGTSQAFHHVGHANVLAYLKRLAATFPSPSKLIVAGSSAGGYGALANFDTLEKQWPSAPSYLIDDSGPPLEVAPQQYSEMFANWNLGALLDPQCACRNALSPLLSATQTKYPNARLSLLSYEQDSVIPTFYGITTAQFETDLTNLTSGVITTPNSKYFLEAGAGHVLLFNPALSTRGTSLVTWLGQQVNGSPAWASLQP